jgi:uncharacterized membrane protein YkvA (DUF1232 family)
MNFTQVLYDNYRKLIRDSKYRWFIILGSALYILSPIDISPDFLPIVGWIDDGVVLTLLMTEVSAILLEKVKAKKDGNVDVASTDGNVGTSGGTVDVDSVQVK